MASTVSASFDDRAVVPVKISTGMPSCSSIGFLTGAALRMVSSASSPPKDRLEGAGPAAGSASCCAGAPIRSPRHRQLQ
jgi:hypothetical protein